jgi:UDP-N-acetylmuramoyl-tripeptide--D-alanyl-D-alanine ligase
VYRGRNWTVIDDSYNASPTSAEAACEWLKSFPVAAGGRRYLVLGDMLELGRDASREHFEIGCRAADAGLQGVLAFGELAGDVARGASRGGLSPGRIVATADLSVLQTVLDCWLEPGDAVLVKGSRGMRMERVVSWLKDSDLQRGVEFSRRCA